MAFENGIILSAVGGLYKVRLVSREVVFARARGSFRQEKLRPLPGDFVTLSGEGEDLVIEEIGERKNSLIRPALSNLTHLFIVIPTAKPAPDLYTADKLISAAADKGIEPCVIITKSDLTPDYAEELYNIYKLGGYCVFRTDKSGSGDGGVLAKIKEADIAAFAGVSGAGKSTLISRLFPELSLATGEVSKKIERGKHTTRVAELYPVSEKTLLADTPGFSMVDFANFDFIKEENVIYSFKELSSLAGKCRYTDCVHKSEDGCAVLEALEDGRIAKSRYESFIKMSEEAHKDVTKK